MSYELIVEGQLADSASAESPLEYIHGSGMLLPKFEANVEDKEPGESVEFTLAPEEGYGTYDERHKIELPLAAFEMNGQLREDLLVPGRILPMYNSDGMVVQGRVEQVGETSVTMDFNHPMAGKTLNFSVKVESVREATEKELTEGLHGEYLPHECDCGHGGCCHGEDDGGCCHDEDKGECCNGGGCSCAS